MTDHEEPSLNTAALKCIMDREIGGLRVHYDELLRLRDKQVELAFSAQQIHLDNLDHQAKRIQDMESKFYSKEAHDNYSISIQEKIDGIRAPNYWWVASATIFVVSLLGGLWTLASIIARIDLNQKHAMEVLEKHMESATRK